jgi:hypothetical protein
MSNVTDNTFLNNLVNSGKPMPSALVPTPQDKRKPITPPIGKRKPVDSQRVTPTLQNPCAKLSQSLKEQGWVTMPLNGKKPVREGWRKYTLETEINWNIGNNIGLITGLASGIIVLDIDSKNLEGIIGGKNNGVEDWNRLIQIYGEPVTMKVRTGNGGYHYYFIYNERVAGLKNASVVATDEDGRKMAWDIRTEGGYVAIPPSVHPDTGVTYSYDYTENIIEMPDWILTILTRQRKPVTGTLDIVSTTAPPVVNTEVSLGNVIANVNQELSKHEEKYKPVSYDALLALINNLAPFRSVNYSDWFPVVFALKNIANKYLENQIYELAHIFSQRCSEKYTAEAVDKKWNQTNTGHAGVGSLLHWLEEDIGHDAYIEFKRHWNIGPEKVISLSLSQIRPIDCYDPYTIYDYEQWATGRVFENKDQADKELLRNISRVIRRISLADPIYIIKDSDGFGFSKKTPGILMKKYGDCFFKQEVQDNNGATTTKKLKLNILSPLFTNVKELTLAGYTSIPYHKHQPAPVTNLFNLFPGFKAERVNLPDNWNDIIGPFLAHMLHIMCSGNMEHFKWLLSWIAYVFRELEKSGIFLSLNGLQGAGKTFIFENFLGPLIYGTKLAIFNNGTLDAITQKHNGVIKDKMLYLIAEADSIENCTTMKARFNKLKDMITGRFLQIELKGLETITIPNFCTFLGCSNNDVSVHIEDLDRHYCVLKCSPAMIGKFDYFNDLASKCTQENANIFYSFMLSDNIKPFLVNIKNIPMTEAKQDIIEACLPRTIQAAKDFFINGEVSISSEYIQISNNRPFISTKNFHIVYQSWLKANDPRASAKNVNNFSSDMKKLPFLEHGRPMINTKQCCGYFLKEEIYDTTRIIMNDREIILREYLTSK